MVLTQNSDVFVSIDEKGINKIILHLMKQKPSLFNYATDFIFNNQALLCNPINSSIDVRNRQNPLLSIVDPITIPGTNLSLNYCLQVKTFSIDFFPKNVFSLPSQISTSFTRHKFAIKLTLSAGFGCPPQSVYENPPDSGSIVTNKLECFDLSTIVVGHFKIIEKDGKKYLTPTLDQIEIIDLSPIGLENILECFIKSTLIFSILPRMSFPIENTILGVLDALNFTIALTPTPNPIPNNPAIEENKLQLFLNVVVN